jgi:hypothetical protein
MEFLKRLGKPRKEIARVKLFDSLALESIWQAAHFFFFSFNQPQTCDSDDSKVTTDGKFISKKY